MRHRVVTGKLEILKTEVGKLLLFTVDKHLRKPARLALQLFFDLIEMIEVDVCIAEGVDEFARLQSGDAGCH